MSDEAGRAVLGEVIVLVGTMSGTAEMVAGDLVDRLKAQGFPSRLVRMEKAGIELLLAARRAIVCTSTYGTGDPPDNGVGLHQLLCDEQPRLDHLAYGVVALGDRTYSATFCGGGRKFDELFARLCARRVLPRLEHDAGSGVFPEDAALPWLDAWIAALPGPRQHQTSADITPPKENSMVSLSELDKSVALAQQLGDDGGPVVLVNVFTVRPDEADQLQKAWSVDAAWMKRQPGFISTQLHRGIAGSGAFLNYAVWESTAHFRRAFTNPEFQATLADYPPSTVASPHLFRKVAVPDICVG